MFATILRPAVYTAYLVLRRHVDDGVQTCALRDGSSMSCNIIIQEVAPYETLYRASDARKDEENSYFIHNMLAGKYVLYNGASSYMQ